MKTRVYFFSFFLILSNAAFAKGKEFHFMDTAVLASIKSPEKLTTLAEFPELVQALPTITEQMYGKKSEHKEWIKKYVFPQTSLLEGAPQECLSLPQSWKLVGYRLHPFASMQLGEKKLAGEGLPQVRLTFQPICSFDQRNETGLAEDNAIHVVYQIFKDPKDFLKHYELRQRYEKAIENQNKESILQLQELYEAFLTHPQRKKDRIVLIELIKKLRNKRTENRHDLSPFENEKASISSIKGETIQSSQSTHSLVHPLVQTDSDFMKKFMEELKQITHEMSIWQIRSQTAGFGQLHWLFSNTEWNPLNRSWTQVPLLIYETSSKSNLPRILMNIGWYDFLSLEQHPDFKGLSVKQKMKISKTHSLVEPQSSLENAKQSAAIDRRLLDVDKTHASTQSCFHCHASQERYSVALRRLQGQGSREFGYLFRAFGYVGPSPYMNRRFIHEVDQVTNKLNQNY